MAALMEHSTSGKRQIERELNIVLTEHKVESSLVDWHNDKWGCIHEEMPQVKLQCVSAPKTGRGMTSSDDIPEATLIHREEPYAAIMLKNFRATHCHFCFNELPPDTVPCLLCTIPLYCSENCGLQASGLVLRKFARNETGFDDVPGDLLEHFSAVTSENLSALSLGFHEHRHECQGAHWPSVLPTDIVLAGRMLMKSMQSIEKSGEESNQLCYHYERLPPEEKLQIHIYSIVLINCLQFFRSSSPQFKRESLSKVVIHISQIKVNSMAIVRIKSIDVPQPLNQSGVPTPSRGVTSTFEQVRVGEAIYSSGSLFNHSCLPNIHAYFLSRKLFIRATENIVRWTPLELSYGPQIGQQVCVHRQHFLEDKYSFRCMCHCCSEINLPDLVLNAFRCSKPNCSGVVLDRSILEYEKGKCHYTHGNREICSEPKLQQNSYDINKVAGLMLEQNCCLPGQCLSCGTSCDLRSLCATADDAERNIRSLQEEIGAEKLHAGSISTALKSLKVLQSTLHALNKKIAKAEDIVSQAFCLFEELQPALRHSIASVKILEKLYGTNHIIIGNELVKLASLQLSLGDFAASDTINRLTGIYFKYYGKHADDVFPHLKWLTKEASKIHR